MWKSRFVRESCVVGCWWKENWEAKNRVFYVHLGAGASGMTCLLVVLVECRRELGQTEKLTRKGRMTEKV